MPTAVPPIASSCSAGKAARNAAHGVPELRDVAGEFLAQRQRRRVLQMGAPDLDDRRERLGLLLQRGAQRLDRRKHLFSKRARRGDVHRGRENVVRRLAEVHVVVGVHQALLPALAAEQLGSAVGEHLIDVHVGLRAGAGLPHHQRKLGIVAAGQHLLGGASDGLRLLFRQQAEVRIDRGRRLLDAAPARR